MRAMYVCVWMDILVIILVSRVLFCAKKGPCIKHEYFAEIFPMKIKKNITKFLSIILRKSRRR